MKLDETQTLRNVEKRILSKVRSFHTLQDFMDWADGMGPKFKAFVFQCMDDVVAGDNVEAEFLLEIKKRNK